MASVNFGKINRKTCSRCHPGSNEATTSALEMISGHFKRLAAFRTGFNTFQLFVASVNFGKINRKTCSRSYPWSNEATTPALELISEHFKRLSV